MSVDGILLVDAVLLRTRRVSVPQVAESLDSWRWGLRGNPPHFSTFAAQRGVISCKRTYWELLRSKEDIGP